METIETPIIFGEVTFDWEVCNLVKLVIDEGYLSATYIPEGYVYEC